MKKTKLIVTEMVTMQQVAMLFLKISLRLNTNTSQHETVLFAIL